MADFEIRKKILDCGTCGSWTITLILTNEEIKDNIKISKSLEDSCLLIKSVTQRTESETGEHRGGFFSMLLNKLGASLLRNISAGKGVVRVDDRVFGVGDGGVQAGVGVFILGLDFSFQHFLRIILKYKAIARMNLN